MANRIAMLEGFDMFSDPGARRKRRRSYRGVSDYGARRSGMTKQQRKFKGCAVKCKGGSGYRRCMKVCLRKGR